MGRTMGRKRKAARNESAFDTTRNSDPCQEASEQQVRSLGGMLEKEKAAESTGVSVRRSSRLMNKSPKIPNKETEQIDLVDTEEQEEPYVEGLSNEPPAEGLSYEPRAEGLSNEPRAEGLSSEPHAEGLSSEPKEPRFEDLRTEPISSQQDLEEKIDFIVQFVKEFNSKASSSDSKEINYKNLYIDSQKKIDSLVEENQQLAKKLEFTLGKVAVYEQLKDVMLSSRERATDADINLPSQAATAQGHLPVAIGPATAQLHLPADGSAANAQLHLPANVPPAGARGHLPADGSPAAAAHVARNSPEKKGRGRKKKY